MSYINITKENFKSEPASGFGVMSIPTLVVMKNGVVVNQPVGVRPKEQILSML